MQALRFVVLQLLLAAVVLTQERSVATRELGSERGFRIVLPAEPDRYADPVPRGRGRGFGGGRFGGRRGRQDNTPSDNRITDAGATLGRVLFYDRRLSVTKTVACASCHRQEHAFADPARVSKGIQFRKGTRNSPSLVNVRFHGSGRFFWDERAASLEEQVLMPIQDRLEMGMKLPALVERLARLGEYRTLFDEAFGDPAVTDQRIAKALAQFVRSLTSFDSRFDREHELAGSVDVDFDGFSRQENLGKRIFFEGVGGPSCASCHARPPRGGPQRRPGGLAGDMFVSSPPRNIGLDRRTGKDRGLGGVTGDAADDGKFKAPSLRNVAVSGPYMHDGRFRTLQQVVEHYSSGVAAHPNVDRRLGRGRRRGMNLSRDEIAALVAFLETLTDRAFLEDPRFADPFR